ncbi:hypothetical protein Tco_1292154 [Tanacetum coccineum]
MKKLIAELPTLTAPMEKEELIVYLVAAREAVSAVPRISVKGQILTDFIVERPEDDSLAAPMEVEEELLDLWTLFTDGSSCIDGSGARLILTDPEGTEFTYTLRFKFDTTNKEVEYEALIADDCDVQATNIILHGLPSDVYALVNHQEAAKDIWDRVNLLMKGTELSYQERECKLYNLFDKTSSNPKNQETIQDGRVTLQQVQGRQSQSFAVTKNRGIATTSRGNYAAGQPRVVRSEAQETCQILDEEQLAFLANPGLSEAPVAQQIIPQNSAFQTKDLDAYDSDCDDLSLAKVVLMANVSSCDSDVLSEEIDTLKQTLSNNVKEKESLSKTLTVFKTESKEKESKYIDKEIVLEKQNKELENIICKMYRSTQAMHMLTKPQVFYDDTHKQALGYQNPFHLKKAQRIQPTLYDGSVIAKEHTVISEIDDKETLILEEESRSKMLDKQNDSISIEKKIKISPIDY